MTHLIDSQFIFPRNLRIDGYKNTFDVFSFCLYLQTKFTKTVFMFSSKLLQTRFGCPIMRTLFINNEQEKIKKV